MLPTFEFILTGFNTDGQKVFEARHEGTMMFVCSTMNSYRKNRTDCVCIVLELNTIPLTNAKTS